MANRKIYFYRIHAGLDENGSPLAYDPRSDLEHVKHLEFSQEGRYLSTSEDEVMCVWPDRTASPQRVGLGRIRRSDLPEMETGGTRSPLPIPEESGIVELTHFVLFPETQIVGEVFNFFGPRVSGLRNYLRQLGLNAPGNLRFEPLLRQNVLEQLDQFGEIRVLDLRIRRSFLSRVEEADDSLAAGFRAAIEVGDAEEAELILRPKAYSRKWLDRGLLQTIRKIARAPDLREDVATFKVKGFNAETESVDTLDLLKDRLVVEAEIGRSRSRTRALAPESAYRAIVGAYTEIQEELVRAASAL